MTSPAPFPQRLRLRLARAWTRAGELSWGWRCLLKTGIFAVFTLFVLYPNPYRFARNVWHLTHLEDLLQADLPARAEINREIDARLAASFTNQTWTPAQEFRAVESYVFQKITYAYDWDQWDNIDYWPTAEEVWARKQEDCDGQAILTANLLRGRGFKTARLVANLSHVWVAVDRTELMGPQKDKNYRQEGKRTVLSLPSASTWLRVLLEVRAFPMLRSLGLLGMLLLLLWHPGPNLAGLFAGTTLGLLGWVLLLDWCHHFNWSTGQSPLGELGSAGFALTAAAGTAWFFGRKRLAPTADGAVSA